MGSRGGDKASNMAKIPYDKAKREIKKMDEANDRRDQKKQEDFKEDVGERNKYYAKMWQRVTSGDPRGDKYLRRPSPRKSFYFNKTA